MTQAKDSVSEMGSANKGNCVRESMQEREKDTEKRSKKTQVGREREACKRIKTASEEKHTREKGSMRERQNSCEREST